MDEDGSTQRQRYSLRPENCSRGCDALILVYSLCHNECKFLRIDSDRLEDHPICSRVVLCPCQREIEVIGLCFAELLKPANLSGKRKWIQYQFDFRQFKNQKYLYFVSKFAENETKIRLKKSPFRKGWLLIVVIVLRLLRMGQHIFFSVKTYFGQRTDGFGYAAPRYIVRSIVQ